MLPDELRERDKKIQRDKVTEIERQKDGEIETETERQRQGRGKEGRKLHITTFCLTFLMKDDC